jgi:hypothetical protein
MSVWKQKVHGLFSGTVLAFAQSKDGEPTAWVPTVMCIMNLLGMSAYIDVPPYFHMKNKSFRKSRSAKKYSSFACKV